MSYFIYSENLGQNTCSRGAVSGEVGYSTTA